MSSNHAISLNSHHRAAHVHHIRHDRRSDHHTLSNSLRLRRSHSDCEEILPRGAGERQRQRQSSESIRCIHDDLLHKKFLTVRSLNSSWQSVALRRKGRIPACSNVSAISHETPSNPFTPSVPLDDTRIAHPGMAQASVLWCTAECIHNIIK